MTPRESTIDGPGADVFWNGAELGRFPVRDATVEHRRSRLAAPAQLGHNFTGWPAAARRQRPTVPAIADR